jgi:hypothetical protein
MWVSALQSFVEAKTMNLESEGQYNMRESFYGDGKANGNANGEPNGTPVAGTDLEMEDLQRKAENVVITLTKELAKMKDLIDTSRSRIDSKSQWKGK